MLNGKRILSLVLALIMVCANLPWDAAATELAEATVATEVTQNAEAAQPDETTQPTEATAPAEELKKEEAAVTDVPAATGASYDEYTTQVTLHVPEYQVGDPIPAPEDIQITVDGATLGEVDGFFLMIGYGDEEPGNIFEAKDYELRFRIHAPEDKPFMSLDTDVVCEGHDVNLSGSSLDYTYLYVRVAYEFDVLPQIGEVDISGIPLDIEAGQAGIPALTLAQEGVQIASATW